MSDRVPSGVADLRSPSRTCRKCRICGNEDGNASYDVPEMMLGLRDVFQYFQCAKCECLQLSHLPEDYARYYPQHYYSYQVKPSPGRVRTALGRLRDRYAVSGTGLIGRMLYARNPRAEMRCLQRLGVNADWRILDVGCGSGRLLVSLRDIGFERLLGIDPFNAGDFQHPNGVMIQKKDILDLDGGDWDVIMFHHSFEHLVEPLETLRAAFRLLKSGGSCLIRIPIVSSFAWEQYGVNWVQLDAPRHTFLHSQQSLQRLAEASGFSITDRYCDSTSFQFWGSEQYAQGIPLSDERSYSRNPRASLFSPKQIARFSARAKSLNAEQRGDQAVFYLRKP